MAQAFTWCSPRKKEGCFHTRSLLQNRWVVPNQFSYYPQDVLCLRCIIVKWGKKAQTLQGFRYALMSSWQLKQQQKQQQRNESRVNLVQWGGETAYWHSDSGVYRTVSESMKEKGWTLSQAVILAAILTSDLLAPVARQHISRLFVAGAGSIVFWLQTKCSRVQMELSRGQIFKVMSVWLFCSTSESKRKRLLILEASNQFLFPEEPLGLERVGWTQVFSVVLSMVLFHLDQKESICCSCACRIIWKALPHSIINIFSTAPLSAGNIFFIRLLWWRSVMMKVKSFSLTEGNLLQRLEIKADIKHICCSVLMRALWQSLWNVVQPYFCVCMQPKVRGIKVNQMNDMHTIHIQSFNQMY